MADSYSRWVMTDAFANNSQAAINAGQKIEWVAIKTSDDSHTFNDLSGFNDTTLATATIRQTTNISSVTITGKTVTITGLFNSNNNTADYYIRTMFLVARYNGKEFLAGATVANSSATAFRMPAASGTEITEFTARPQISVSNTSTISATVNPVASATNERVDSLEADTQAKIDYLTGEKDMLWDRFKDFVTKATAETVTGVKTFTQTIVGSITGNAGTATKLQTGRKINGTIFDGTSDINVPASNDAQLVHKSGDEVIFGAKVFNDEVSFIRGINGAFKSRQATFTDFAYVATHMTEYAGYWFTKSTQQIANSPFGPTFGIVEVIPGDIPSSGKIVFTPYDPNDGFIYYSIVTWQGLGAWRKEAQDTDVVHKTGIEVIEGLKKFKNGVELWEGVEIYNQTPFLDFHFNNESVDYTLRIIEAERGVLNVFKSGSTRGTIDANLRGVADRTKQLDVARKINGVNFDGTSDITIDPVTRIISSPVDIFTLGNGFYYNAGAASTNKPAGSSVYFTFEIFQTSSNGFIRLIDHTGASFFATKDGGAWRDWRQVADNAAVVHNSGDEIVGGNKEFTGKNSFAQLIQGAFKTRTATFTDFSQVATNMEGYAGNWVVKGGHIENSPVPDDNWMVVEVTPGDFGISGKITVTPYDNGLRLNTIYYAVIRYDGVINWQKIAKDSDVVHKNGQEDIFGLKSLRNGVVVYEGFEVFNETPFIDFHFNNDEGDFTARIIEASRGILSVIKGDSTRGMIDADLLGVADRASKLNTPRKINGTDFDGTADINVNAANDASLVHKSGAEVVGGDKEFTGTTTLANVTSKNVIKKSMTLNNIILDFAETASGVVVYVHSNGRSFLMDSVWHDAGTLPAGITPPPTIVIADSTEPAGIVGLTTRMGFNIKISISPTGKIGYKLSSLLQGDTTARTADVSFDAYTSWFK